MLEDWPASIFSNHVRLFSCWFQARANADFCSFFPNRISWFRLRLKAEVKKTSAKLGLGWNALCDLIRADHSPAFSNSAGSNCIASVSRSVFRVILYCCRTRERCSSQYRQFHWADSLRFDRLTSPTFTDSRHEWMTSICIALSLFFSRYQCGVE